MQVRGGFDAGSGYRNGILIKPDVCKTQRAFSAHRSFRAGPCPDRPIFPRRRIQTTSGNSSMRRLARRRPEHRSGAGSRRSTKAFRTREDSDRAGKAVPLEYAPWTVFVAGFLRQSRTIRRHRRRCLFRHLLPANFLTNLQFARDICSRI